MTSENYTLFARNDNVHPDDYDFDDWYDDDEEEGELEGKKNVIFVPNWIEGQG